MTTDIRGVGFRIKPSENISEELDRLAKVISQKYKKEVRIYIKEMKNGRNGHDTR